MKRLHFLLFSLLAAATLHAQTVAPSAGEPSATFKSQLPVVLVDVVVTNSHGDPVAGLKDADFQLFENGKRQTMASFEEHKTVVPTQVKLPLMPPGVFTNYPVVAAADCVNVLLIDGLNTSLMEDQSYVHEQILKYLKTLPRGAQVAIFTLTTRLRMLQEFTTDSSALLAAVNAAGLYKSPLVQERLEKEEQEEMLSFIEKSRAGPLPLQDWAHEAVDPAGALQAMFAEEASHLALTRLRTTLDSMQELARYLAAFPGRKNLLWVSGSFPIMFFPREDLAEPFQFASVANFRSEIAHTARLLTAARVAIYPVGAQGLMTDTYYQASAGGVGSSRPSPQSQVNSLSNDMNDRVNTHATMDELASDTGGRAFYDTNGIGDVLTRATNNSADFYTISYVPTNRKMDGRFRSITVKLASRKQKLSYRRGYYADAVDSPVARQISDPLLPQLAFGVPDVSQIVYKIRIAPSKTPAPQNADENNTNLKHRELLTTYDIDFAVSVQDLKLDPMPDGTRRGNIEVKAVAYDDYGKPLNLVGGDSAISLNPSEYAAMQRVGLQIHQRIDVPGTVQVHLHTGICDLNTGKIGTLGIRVDKTHRTPH